MSEFIKELNEIKGDLVRNRTSPNMTASHIALRLIQLIDVLIKENQRLEAELTEMNRVLATKKAYTPAF